MFLVTGKAFAYAGNEDRSGQAGASELLINPWARSGALGGANTASVTGLEATYLNIAGTAFTRKTEIGFSNTNYLKGTDIKVNAFGLTQKVGESGVVGISLMSMNFGDMDITTTDLPEGGVGTFSPRMLNVGFSYAKAFSKSIYGGINLKIISEGISNVSASGMALDAGIQYVTGIGNKKDGTKHTENIRFGITLKNVGPPIKYSGDGLSLKGTVIATGSDLTLQQRSEKFELPSLISIGGSYIAQGSGPFGATFSGSFTSNSFSKDGWAAGADLNYRKYFSLRFAYYFEQKAKKDAAVAITSLLSGPSTGFSLNLPLGKGSAGFAIDYSVRFTRVFENIHSVGIRVNL